VTLIQSGLQQTFAAQNDNTYFVLGRTAMFDWDQTVATDSAPFTTIIKAAASCVWSPMETKFPFVVEVLVMS
jgi:hypothetical protein